MIRQANMFIILYREEPMFERLVRKSKREPLVPMGLLMTCGALYFAAKALKTGDSKLANRMFYWRVGLQAFTVASLVGGAYWMRLSEKQKIDRDEQMRVKAKAREKMWIDELERIDDEAKARQERAKSIQEAFLQRREESKAEEESKKEEKKKS